MPELFRLISMAFVLVFAENTVFARAIDTTTLLSVSRNRNNVFSFGVCTLYFSIVTSLFGYFADKILLYTEPESKLIYQPFVYIFLISIIYIITLVVLWKMFYKLFLRLKRFIHLSAINCAILGAMFLNADECSSLREYIFRGIGMGIGFYFAVYTTAIVYDRLHNKAVPYCFRGYPVTLIYIGILSMAFYGLAVTSIKY